LIPAPLRGPLQHRPVAAVYDKNPLPTQRLAWARRKESEPMTAILGLACTDGVLLLADTEASFTSGTKSECEKLQYLSVPHGSILCAASGDLRDAEYASVRLQREVLQSPMTCWNAIHNNLETLPLDISARHGRYLNVDMLIAIHPFGINSTRMFRWVSDLIYPVNADTHACAGSGMIQLDPLLRHLDFNGPSDVMLLYGIRLMLDAKRIVQGVGGKTEAAVLYHRSPSHRWFGTILTDKIEALVLEMEQHMNRVSMPFVAGQAESLEQIDTAFTALTSGFKDFRQRYQEIIRLA
jgi:hypothetical protein